VFSAHSVPVAVIDSGDPYQRQIERTVDLVWERGGWAARRHICYQSKVGASKWLRPSMHETVKNLAAAGIKARARSSDLVCVRTTSRRCTRSTSSTVEQARALGIEDYRMMPGLNDSPDFIQALAGLVKRGGSVSG